MTCEVTLSNSKREVIHSHLFSAARKDALMEARLLASRWLDRINSRNNPFQLSRWIGGWDIGYWGVRVLSRGRLSHFVNLEVIDETE